MYAEFEDVYYDVSYVSPKENPENAEQVNSSLHCGFVKNIIYICVFQYFCAFTNEDNIK